MDDYIDAEIYQELKDFVYDNTLKDINKVFKPEFKTEHNNMLSISSSVHIFLSNISCIRKDEKTIELYKTIIYSLVERIRDIKNEVLKEQEVLILPEYIQIE